MLRKRSGRQAASPGAAREMTTAFDAARFVVVADPFEWAAKGALNETPSSSALPRSHRKRELPAGFRVDSRIGIDAEPVGQSACPAMVLDGLRGLLRLSLCFQDPTARADSVPPRAASWLRTRDVGQVSDRDARVEWRIKISGPLSSSTTDPGRKAHERIHIEPKESRE